MPERTIKIEIQILVAASNAIKQSQ